MTAMQEQNSKGAGMEGEGGQAVPLRDTCSGSSDLRGTPGGEIQDVLELGEEADGIFFLEEELAWELEMEDDETFVSPEDFDSVSLSRFGKEQPLEECDRSYHHQQPLPYQQLLPTIGHVAMEGEPSGRLVRSESSSSSDTDISSSSNTSSVTFVPYRSAFTSSISSSSGGSSLSTCNAKPSHAGCSGAAGESPPCVYEHALSVDKSGSSMDQSDPDPDPDPAPPCPPVPGLSACNAEAFPPPHQPRRRALSVARYLWKRKRRTWARKPQRARAGDGGVVKAVSDSRKEVALKRERLHGRFVPNSTKFLPITKVKKR